MREIGAMRSWGRQAVAASMWRRVWSALALLLGLLLPNAAHAVIDLNTSLNPINVLLNQTSSLKITLLNSASLDGLGLTFTNNLPAGMVVQSVTSNSCGGTLTATPGAGSVSMAGGTVPRTVGFTTGQCSIIVVVQGITAGTLVNTMLAGSVTTTNEGSNPDNSQTTLTVSTPSNLTGSKTFSTAFIKGGAGTSVATITLTNPNTQSLTGLAFTDTLPAGLMLASPPAASTTCGGGTLTALAGANSVSLAGGTIAGSASCTLIFSVAAATPTVAQSSAVINTIPANAITTIPGATNATNINSGNLSIQTGGVLLKTFAPTSILANGVATSMLTLTLQNRNRTALTGVTLTDTFPAGMVVAAVPTGLANTCGGSVSAPPGATSITLSGATVPASSSVTGTTGNCTVMIKVVATTAGTLTNSMSGTFGDATGPTAYPAVNTVLTTTAPAVSVSAKTFAPATEAPGGISTLTLTLSNEFGSSAAITSFTDDLLNTMGAGFSVAASPAATTTCGGTVVAAPGATTISMSTGAIPAATLVTTPGTCTITVPIQLDSTGLTAGVKTNSIPIGGLATSQGNNAAARTATLTVALPTVTKAFLPTSAAIGPNSTLTITLTNPSSSAATITSFSDDLSTMGGAPGGFQIASAASTTCAGATLTADVSTKLVSLAGGTIPANSSCTITVPIQVLAGTPTGIYTNTVASGALVTSRGTTNVTSTAPLTVTASAVSKAFAPVTQAAGLTSTLTITLSNPSTLATTISAFTDNLGTMGAGFTVAASPAASSTCLGHNLSAAAGGTSITMTAGTIPASSSCTITVPVQIATTVGAGTRTNTIAAGALVTSAGSNTVAATAPLTVIVPSVSKVFNPATAGPGPNTTLTITLTNPSSNPAVLTSAFTDNLSSMHATRIFTVAASPAASSTCVGNNLIATPGTQLISMTAGTIPALGSCTITVPVQIPSDVVSGTVYTNTIAVAALKTDKGNNAASATAALTARRPSIVKNVSSGAVVQGQPTTFTIRLENLLNPTPATITSFTDNLTTMDGSGRFVVASTSAATSTCVGNNLSATPGGTSITMTAGTIPANGNCTITVPVVPLATISTGSKTNTIFANALQTSQGSNPTNVTRNVTVNPSLTCSNAYSPTSVGPSQLTTMTVTLTHANGAPAFTGLSFADALPAGQTVAAVPNVVSTCGGTLTAVAGSNSVSLVNGSLPTGATSCFVSVDIKAPALVGPTTNTFPAPTTAEGYTCSSSPSATLTVSTATAPNVFLNKNFSPSFVNGGGFSQLQLLIDNTATGAVALSGVSLTDALPTGMILASNPDPKIVSGACTMGVMSSTPGATEFTMSGGTIAAGTVCTVGVNVTSYIEGSLINSIPALSMTSAQLATNSNVPSTTFTVLRNVGITKYFSPSTIAVNGISTLNLTLFNTNELVRTEIAFTDSFPPGVTVAAGATTNTCGGTLTAAVGGASLALSGVTLPSNVMCTLSVPVTSSAVGSYVNNIPAGVVSTFEGSTNPDPTTATLTVINAPTISKAFGASSIALGGSTTLTFTLSNANASALTSGAFSDNLVNMSIATPGAATGTCAGVGSNLFSAGQTALNFTGLTLPASGNCTVIVNVTSSVAGVHPNTTSGVTTAQTTVAGLPSNTANLTVLLPPSISKSFSHASIGAGEAATLTIVVSNPNSSAIGLASSAAYTDIFPVTPGQMQVASPLVSSSTCSTGGTASTLRNSSNTALTAGDVGIQINGGTIAAGGTCTITVAVSTSVAGNYTNNTSVVSGSVAGSSAGVGTASMLVLQQPIITKAFSPDTIFTGASSTLTITLSNPNALDAINLSAPAFTDVFPVSPGQMSVISPATASTTCTGATLLNSTGGPIAAGNPGIRLDGGSIAAGGSCSVTVNVTVDTAGVYNNTTSVLSSINSGSSLTGGSSTLTASTSGVNVSGQLYADVNHNMTRDTSESWSTGTTAYVKLFLNCTGTAVAVRTLNVSAGSYTFTGVAAGSYCLVLANNASTASTAPSTPSGWLNMTPASGQLNITVGALNLQDQDFGLYNGSNLTGRVFADTGTSGGTPNNGVLDGAEIGIPSVTVRLTDCGATTYSSTTTAGDGTYALATPTSLSLGAPLCVVETNQSGYVSTGGQPGNTGGTYDRTNDRVQFILAASVSYVNINFGDVPGNRFLTDGSKTALPGSTVSYLHIFIAGTGGQVSFSTVATASPSVAGWTEVLYLDANCDGVLSTPTDSLLTGSQTVAEGQRLCLIQQQFVSGGAGVGASNLVTVLANFVYTNASPALTSSHTRQDLTTTSNVTLQLYKEVRNVTQGGPWVLNNQARAGEELEYRITYTNNGVQPIMDLVTRDMTPAYTVFVSGQCVFPLPANLTGCTVVSPPVSSANSSIQWQFTGSLASSVSGIVTYRVKVE